MKKIETKNAGVRDLVLAYLADQPVNALIKAEFVTEHLIGLGVNPRTASSALTTLNHSQHTKHLLSKIGDEGRGGGDTLGWWLYNGGAKSVYTINNKTRTRITTATCTECWMALPTGKDVCDCLG